MELGSGSCRRQLPLVCGLRPEEAESPAGDEVALEIEGVVGGSMDGEEALS